MNFTNSTSFCHTCVHVKKTITDVYQNNNRIKQAQLRAEADRLGCLRSTDV